LCWYEVDAKVDVSCDAREQAVYEVFRAGTMRLFIPRRICFAVEEWRREKGYLWRREGGTIKDKIWGRQDIKPGEMTEAHEIWSLFFLFSPNREPSE